MVGAPGRLPGRAVLTDTGHMSFSLAIVALVLLWTWLLATRVPDRAVLAVGAAVIALAV